MVIVRNNLLKDIHFVDAQESAYKRLNSLDNNIVYHRKAHTTDVVVPAALEIATKEGFSRSDTFHAGISAAFHDTGFLVRYNDNEPDGDQFCIEYMSQSELPYSQGQVDLAGRCIRETSLSATPTSIHAKVLRDADLAYFGRDAGTFLSWLEDLQLESSLHPESPLHQASLDHTTWGLSSYKFIKNHCWETDAAQDLYDAAKQRNLATLQEYFDLAPDYL